MQKFIRFWKKDYINKLIVLVVLLITTVVAIDIFLFMTPNSSGTSILADLFPTPTTEIRIILTQNAETAIFSAAEETESFPPTISVPFTPIPKTATIIPTLPSAVAPTFTPQAPAAFSPSVTAATPTRQATTTEVVAGTPGPMQPSSSASGLACIPDTPAQTGKAVDILDGSTIKVLIDGLVYSVRYLGIKPPEDEYYAGRTSAINGKLVFGKEISLIADGPEKDQLGRLLRYVKVGETFVNLELIQQGLATTENTEPPISCLEVFKNAEQSAREAQIGMWKIAPAP